MKTQFERMMEGLNDVKAFLAGERDGFKAHVPEDVDGPADSARHVADAKLVREITGRLGMKH